jgi:oligoendopeptidase F
MDTKFKTEWDFEDWIHVAEFEEERKQIEKEYDSFKQKWEKDKSYLINAEKLYEALSDIETLAKNFSHGGEEYYYYWLKQELNQNDTEIRKKFQNIEEFRIEQANKILFFKIELSKISIEKQKEFLSNERLKEFHAYLKELFENSRYILSEKEEKILSLKSNVSYEMWVRMVSSLLAKETRKALDETGNEKEFVYPELINLMKSEKQEVRDSAKEAFEDIMQKYEEIAEFEINAVLEEAKINDNLRGFSRPDESRIKEDLIDFDFVDSLLEAVKEKFSISRELYSLKTKLMRKEKIGYYERAAELLNIDKKYDENYSVEIIGEVFSKIDSQFLEIFKEMLERGRIDFFPKKGKHGGAFCVKIHKKYPVYIILNHTGKFRDVTTLAHEMGHAINDYLMREQKEIYYDSPKSTAEVASIFMEDFVYEKIIENLNEQNKFYLKIAKLEDDISSIQRQIALYSFEREIHETFRKEGYLSKEKIGKIFGKWIGDYLGDSVDLGNINLWWIYWEHIRMYFYVYSYASGALISKAMQKKFREDKSFIEKVKKFLSAGISKKPREIFKELGIEINKEFFMQGLSELEKELEDLKILGKKLGKL